MRQAEFAQRRWLPHVAMPGLPMAQLKSLRGTLRVLAVSGWHLLVMPLHQARSREAARVLRRYRNLVDPVCRDIRERWIP
jgi:hypothetical protein